ncbi:MAG: hypothetical protein MUE30_15720, partial [Spirosomaceae bacterium]|nr:hypothetical protein [Spirosomataceae bacterium]
MSELILKYNSLDDFGKQELMDFLDFLVLKKKPLATLTKNGYKEKILQVSFSDNFCGTYIQPHPKSLSCQERDYVLPPSPG